MENEIKEIKTVDTINKNNIINVFDSVNTAIEEIAHKNLINPQESSDQKIDIFEKDFQKVKENDLATHINITATSILEIEKEPVSTGEKTHITSTKILKKEILPEKELPPLNNVKIWGPFIGPIIWLSTGFAKLLTAALVEIFAKTIETDTKPFPTTITQPEDKKPEEIKNKIEIIQCICDEFNLLEKKNDKNELESLQKGPSLKKCELKNISGFQQIGNNCYLNASLQVLFNLINTVGEEPFEIYNYLNKDFLQNEIDDSIKNQKETHKKRYEYLLNKSKNCQINKNNVFLLDYFEQFAVRDLANKANLLEIYKRVDLYLETFKNFEELRKQHKNGKVEVKTLEAFRQNIYDLILKDMNRGGLSSQQDAIEVIPPLLFLLGAPMTPQRMYYLTTYSFNEDNYNKIKEHVPQIEDEIEEKEECLFAKDKFNFKKNCLMQPTDIAQVNKDNIIFEMTSNPGEYKKGHTLSDLDIEEHFENIETFRCGRKFSDFKDDKNCPLIFPDSVKELKENYKDLKEQVRVIDAKREMFLDAEQSLPFLPIYLNRAGSCYEHPHPKKSKFQVMPNKELIIKTIDIKSKEIQGEIKQQLIGVCIQSGSVEGGHWYAYIKKEDGKWYKCNDSSVDEVMDEEQMFKQMSVLGSFFMYAPTK